MSGDDSAECHDDLHVLASMTSVLLALPNELLIKILETLDFRSLMTCERVCGNRRTLYRTHIIQGLPVFALNDNRSSLSATCN
jgi:hypothetical protein